MPSVSFLRDSVALWKARHTYRQQRLNVWRRRESYRYTKWKAYRRDRPEGDPLRAKWWKLYEEADIAVDKWTGLRDEATYWLGRRRGQLAEHGAQMSDNFHASEFDTHDGTKVPEMAYDGLRALCRDVLEPMRDRFGACHVTSGYRHRAYNASIGGAASSYHIYDLRDGDEVAADVTFERGTPAQWAAHARSLAKGGVGQYDRSGFVHVDNGPRRDWWG